MTSECRSILKGERIRATRLNECGEVVYGACAYVVTAGFVTINVTANVEDPTEYKQKTASGAYCYPPERGRPLLNWHELEIEFCDVNPELFELLTGSPLVLNDSLPPVAVGFGQDTDSYASTFFALETWVGVARGGLACPAGGVRYGYINYPYVYQGTVGDITIEDGPINFTINAIAPAGNAWGIGPHDVILDNAGAPSPLLEAIPTTRIQHVQWTSLAPPAAACGCQALAQVS